MKNNFKVVLLRGDGIGPEIIDEAVKILEKISVRFGFSIKFEEALLGGCAIDQTGIPLPQETIDKCLASDGVLLGAVGGYQWETLPGHLRPEAGLLGIRSALELYANLRPTKIFPALKGASPLRPDILEKKTDILIVRELTGGIYFGERGRGSQEGTDFAWDTERYSVPEIQRIARIAFESAGLRDGRVCSVDKANVLESSRLWRETVIALAEEEYPNIKLSHMYVDNCAMQLVRDPSQFDVIVTSNIFGDILSDEASMISGSIGMIPSASLGNGTLGLYEPIHGSAPDIAGQGIANPAAAILSAAMLLRYSMQLSDAAIAIEQAVEAVVETHRTADIWQESMIRVGCQEFGRLVAEKL